MALNNMSLNEDAASHSLHPRWFGQHFVMGRAFVDAQSAHLADVLSDPDYDPRRVLQSVAGYRSRRCSIECSNSRRSCAKPNLVFSGLMMASTFIRRQCVDCLPRLQNF